ncbi:MAG: phage holin family protein [Ferruginibacter sp.]
MENQPNTFESLFEKAGDYLETRMELWKLKATQKSSDIISTIASRLIAICILMLFVILSNIGIALLLGEWLGKPYYGFLILAGFYLIAGLIFSAFKNKWVKEPVTNAIIKKIYS